MIEHTFLIEIGTDELPPKILKKLSQDLSAHIVYEFNQNNIHCNNTKWFAAPRHLATKTKIKISENSPWSMQNHNFYNPIHNTTLTSFNNNKDNLHIATNHNDKQPYQFCKNNLLQKQNENKKNFNDLLLSIVKQSLKKLINYKMMKWSNVHTPFIRPVHTVTILLDSQLITGHLFEINIDRILHGHRYIQHNKIIINHANDYPDILKTKGCILVDYDLRKNILQKNVEKCASNLGGVVDIRNEKFLEEITSLIEWPMVLSGKFDKKFLNLPPEVIIHIMQKNQKYFPVYNIIDGILLPCFIFVVNTITKNYKKIITGHENIIKARFTDAEFFLKNDNQHHLEEYIPKLNSILFHSKLGSMREKVDRITELSAWIANQINENVFQAKRAGYLCKCDLISDMVREFPELQGIIGMHYARRDGETEQVALAQKEHYQPKCVTDTVPKERISCIVSISDKIDTISGIFGIEKFPTHNKDPFALKRSAIGILNIISQQKLSLNLTNLIHKSVKLYGTYFTNKISVINNIHNFMYNRLCSYYLSQGYKLNIIKSVININLANIIAYEKQIKAIDNFCKLKPQEYNQLHLIYKRISNILKKQNTLFDNKNIQNSLLNNPKEIELFLKTINKEKEITLLCEKNQYQDALIKLTLLSSSIHIFLDNVIIMDNNEQIRINRLILLNKLKKLILKVINIPILEL